MPWKVSQKKKLRKAKPVGGNSSSEKRKDIVSDADSKILNEQIGEPDNEFNKLSKSKKEVCSRYNIGDLFLGEYDWLFISVTKKWRKSKMPLIQSDEEKYFSVPSIAFSKGVKEGKRLKILTSNNLLSKVITNKTWKQSKPKTRNQKILYLLYHQKRFTTI